MTERMTMNRVIHGAVRRDLDRLEEALARFPAGDTGRAQELRRGYANLRRELTHHHETEDDLIFPMLGGAGVDAELLRTMEAEHERMATALAAVTQALDGLASSPTAETAGLAHDRVAEAQQVVAQHLDHEERELEPAMKPHVGSPEWDEVQKQLRKRPLGEVGSFFAWLTDGIDEDRLQYLRSEIPAPVVTVLSKVFGRRYRREVAPIWRQ